MMVQQLTPREMESLTAISDTLLPSLDHSLPHHSTRTFYRTSASMLGTPQTVGGYMAAGKVRHALIGLLRLALWLLSTWYGTFILCGKRSLSNRFPYFRKLANVELNRKEEILRSWSDSYFLKLRQLYKAIKVLVLFFYFTQVDEKERNPSWAALGYCGPDPRHVAGGNKEEHRLGPLERALVHMDSPSLGALSAALARSGITLLTTPRDASIQFQIQCDAVVVGSGSGGGVVAGVLARAGYKVVVVEKGGYEARGGLSLLEGASLERMYEGGGLLATDDMGIMILSGSTVGGGSTVNWSASLRTPDHVMREWREDHGLDLFGSHAYEEALRAVCARMGVQPDVGAAESLSNAALRRGCAELGYPVSDIPRNAPPDHDCGWCCFGCPDGRKKGTAETWLIDMAQSGNGVVLPGCRALEVLREEQGRGRRPRAAGVVLEYESRRTGGRISRERCVVAAEVTVVACGALGTPVLLKRSGLSNPSIGRNLHLHPVVMVWGHFPCEAEAEATRRSYEGGIMTAMSTVPSSSGYGAIIQTPSLHPGFYSVVTPWVSAADFRERMTRFARTAHMFALARDRGSGRVDASGSVTYKMDGRDEQVLKRGVERMLRIMAAAGAAEVGTSHPAGDRLDLQRAGAREVEGFVGEAARRGLRDLSSPVCSAHQMGSCRMGVRAEVSAVDARGEAWEVEGLFVADSSVFPTALGVNPMVTVQAIAYCTAHSVLDLLLDRRKTNSSSSNSNSNSTSCPSAEELVMRGGVSNFSI